MNIETIKIFLESQPLLSIYLVIGIGYALGEVNIRGFSLGVGAVILALAFKVYQALLEDISFPEVDTVKEN